MEVSSQILACHCSGKKKKNSGMLLVHWEKKKHQRSKKRLERQRGNKFGKKISWRAGRSEQEGKLGEDRCAWEQKG